MAGAIDLYAGVSSIAGSNLFSVDKSPLDEISSDISNIIGGAASTIGSDLANTFESLFRAVMGFPQEIFDFASGAVDTLEADVKGTVSTLGEYFGNLESFLGELNPLDPNFNPIAAAGSFISGVIGPTGLLATLVDGLINAVWIPILDVSKIGNLGSFVSGVVSTLTADIQGTIDTLGSGFTSLVTAIFNGLNLSSVVSATISDVEWIGQQLASSIGSAVQVAGEAWTAIQSVAGNITSLVTDGAATAWTTIEAMGVDVGAAIGTVVGNIAATIANLYNTWFGGSSSTGQPADVITTVAAIKIAVESGYTLETFPTSTTGWVIPTGVSELNGIVINPGNNGFKGNSGSGSQTGGVGGNGGSYVVEPIDLTPYTLGTSTLNFVVGAPSAVSGGVGTTSKITNSSGVALVTGTSGIGGIPSPLGWAISSGTGGNGGNGGNGSTTSGSGTVTSGTSGTASAVAEAGAGGAGLGVGGVYGSYTATSGVAGGGGTTGNVPLCSGSGGGGGGGAACNSGNNFAAMVGGAGGNGGYPGGGGAGSGAGAGLINESAGAYGYGGNGFTAVLYR